MNITHFAGGFACVRPFLDTQHRAVLRSRFAVRTAVLRSRTAPYIWLCSTNSRFCMLVAHVVGNGLRHTKQAPALQALRALLARS
ncbi:hypothetical protein, partial [Methylibium sp.]|uniref:hypothetical protein n=1 Tax=Methylibium sp. TaxID=2067992 RepID=UPI00286ABF2B